MSFRSFAQEANCTLCSADFNVAVNGCRATVTIPSPPPGAATPYLSIWNWGDNTSNNSTNQTITHDYPSVCNGNFVITRTAQCKIGLTDYICVVQKSVTINVPQVSVAVTASNTTPGCNEVVTLTYTICLTACAPAPDPLIFTANVPGGFSVMPGGSFNMVGGVPTLTIPPSSFTNNLPSCVSATLNLQNTSGINVPQTVTLNTATPSCSMAVTPATLPIVLTPGPPNLSVTKTVVAETGPTVRFRITVTNNGNVSLNNVELKDVFQSPMFASSYPSGFSVNGNMLSGDIGTLNPGQTYTGEFVFGISPDICAAALRNEAYARVPNCQGNSNTAWAIGNFGAGNYILFGLGPTSVTNLSAVKNQLPANGPHRVHVQGTLNIDEPYSIPSGSDFLMGSGAEIRVMAGIALEADNTLFHACHFMWDGINIENNASLDFSDCSLEHAVYAVNVLETSNKIHIKGTTFDCNYVGFRAAPTALARKAGNWLFAGNVFMCSSSLRQNYVDQWPLSNSATTNPEGINPTALPISYAGMEINDVPLLTVDHLPQTRTRFVRQNLGIVIQNSTVTATRCDFDDILPYNIYANAGTAIIANAEPKKFNTLNVGDNSFVNACYFKNCENGIAATSCNVFVLTNYFGTPDVAQKIKNTAVSTNACSGKTQKVSENRIYARRRGVMMSNATLSVGAAMVHANRIYIDERLGFPVQDNSAGVWLQNMRSSPGATTNTGFNVIVRDNPIMDISRCRYGAVIRGGYLNWVVSNRNINLRTEGANNHGISTIGGTEHKIIYNNIVSFWNNIVDQNPIGIYSNNTPTQTVCDNYVANHFAGIQIARNCNSMRLALNNMGYNEFGLYCINLLQDKPIFGAQIHTGNEWTAGLNYLVAAYTENDPKVFLANSFVVNDNPNDPQMCGNSNYMPKSRVPLSGWFDSQKGCVNEVCNWPLFMASPPVAGYLDTLIVLDSVGHDYWINARKYADRLYLLEKIQKKPGLAPPGSLFADFAANGVTQNFGKLLKIGKQLDTLHQMNPIEAAQVQTNLALLDTLSDQIIVLQAQLQDSLNAAAQAAILQQLEALWQNYAGTLQSHNTLLSNWHSNKTTTALTVQANNAAISSSEDFELNEKVLNAIQLSQFINGSTVLSAVQAAQVLSIAQQCPLSGGNAVYRARGIYAGINPDQSYDSDSLLCVGLGGRSATPFGRKMSDRLTISPNPSNGLVMVALSVKDGLTARFELFDLSGRLVYQGVLTDNLQSVDLSMLPKGLYAYRVVGSSAANAIGKIILH